MTLGSLIHRGRNRAQTLADQLAFVPPALIRGKLHSLGDVTEFFTSWHVPLPALNARVVAGTELFGGILLLLGLGARLVALPLAFTMAIAILTAKRADIDSVVALVGFEEWSYLVMFLAIVLLGPGALSVDALLARRLVRP